MSASKITLAQTLSGDWVITIENPFEDGFETEIARFETSATAAGSPAFNTLIECAAACANRMARTLGDCKLKVSSHSAANREWMIGQVNRQRIAKVIPII